MFQFCGGFHPLAQKHSQNSDKNIQEPGEKITPNILCRNMCQRHQNWFAEYLARGKKTNIQGKVSENSFLTFRNISHLCNSVLHVYIAPLKIFRVQNQLVLPSNKDAVKEKVNVQSSRNNPPWRQNGRVIFTVLIQGLAKLLRHVAACKRKL